MKKFFISLIATSLVACGGSDNPTPAPTKDSSTPPATAPDTSGSEPTKGDGGTDKTPPKSDTGGTKPNASNPREIGDFKLEQVQANKSGLQLSWSTSKNATRYRIEGYGSYQPEHISRTNDATTNYLLPWTWPLLGTRSFQIEAISDFNSLERNFEVNVFETFQKDAAQYEEIPEQNPDSVSNGFGRQLSATASSSRIFAGIPFETIDGQQNAGAVRMMVRQDSQYDSSHPLIKPSLAQEDAQFGFQVQFNAKRRMLVISSPFYDEAGKKDVGAIYVYQHINRSGQWEEIEKITGSSEGEQLGLQFDVSHDGNYLLANGKTKVSVYQHQSGWKRIGTMERASETNLTGWIRSNGEFAFMDGNTFKLQKIEGSPSAVKEIFAYTYKSSNRFDYGQQFKVTLAVDEGSHYIQCLQCHYTDEGLATADFNVVTSASWILETKANVPSSRDVNVIRSPMKTTNTSYFGLLMTQSADGKTLAISDAASIFIYQRESGNWKHKARLPMRTIGALSSIQLNKDGTHLLLGIHDGKKEGKIVSIALKEPVTP